MSVDISKLEVGDGYYNEAEGWVEVAEIVKNGGDYMLYDSDGQSITSSKSGQNVYGNSEYNITAIQKLGSQPPSSKPDMVHQPSHYQLIEGLEVKDVRKAIFDKIPMGKLTYHQVDMYSRAWEYLTRCCFKHESPREDLQKAQTYLNWLVESLSEQEQP